MTSEDPTITEFVQRDYPRLVNAVALVTGSYPEAEDLVQEALARAWSRIDRTPYRIGSRPSR